MRTDMRSRMRASHACKMLAMRSTNVTDVRTNEELRILRNAMIYSVTRAGGTTIMDGLVGFAPLAGARS